MTFLEQFELLRAKTPHIGFQCVQKEFQILNHPYNKEEYFKETARITDQMKRDGQWGKWFASTYPEVLTYGI